MDFLPGSRIENKFAVEALIGRGGMGYVVRARHLVLDQLVAIKFLNPHIATMPEAVERFVREARAATRITSEHVARVLDVATAPDGDPYMVMEFLQGRDLDDLVEKGGPVSFEVAVDYVLQASIAVAEAHAIGIVHRDLKPSNLFLTWRSDGSPLVKVLDFGISKVLPTDGDDPGSNLTQTSAVMGSPLYISPEQMRTARDVTGATDIWALGIILYELMSGRHPFEGATMPALCAAVINDPPMPISMHIRDLPPGFEAVVMRCLEKEPKNRWPDITSLATALEPFAPPGSRMYVERIRGIARTASAARFSNQPRGSAPSSPSLAPIPTPSSFTEAARRPRPPTHLGVTASAFELGGVVRSAAARRYVVILAALSAAVGVLLLLFVVTRPSAEAPGSQPPSAARTEVEEPPAPAPSPSASPTPSPSAAAVAAPAIAPGAARAAPLVPSGEPLLADDSPAPADGVATSSPRARPRPAPVPNRAPAASGAASARGRRYGGRE